MKVFGNAEVVDAAKSFWKESKKGQLSYCGFVGVAPVGEGICFTHAGDQRDIPGCITGLKTLIGELEGMVDAKQTKQISGKTANYHEHNLATDPVNFDFVHWLIDAEMIRRRFGAPYPLRVGFRGHEALTEKGKHAVDKILRPLLTLIGAVESDEAIGGWRKAMFTPSEIVAGAKRGEEVPLFKADDASLGMVANWLHGRKPVVITLREANHFPFRNSKLDVWTRFARDLKARGEDVVFVRDTAKGNEAIPGFETYPQASFIIQKRMALYELAKVNFFVSNGPSCMGVWSKAPYIYMIHLEEHEYYYANRPDWWLQQQGIGQGEQWPWALPNQRMVWAEPTYENLCAAWEGRCLG